MTYLCIFNLRRASSTFLCLFYFDFYQTWLRHNCKYFVKYVRIRSYSGPHSPAFGVNTDEYSVSLRIQSECEKIRTRITPNTDTFYTVKYATKNLFVMFQKSSLYESFWVITGFQSIIHSNSSYYFKSLLSSPKSHRAIKALLEFRNTGLWNSQNMTVFRNNIGFVICRKAFRVLE